MNKSLIGNTDNDKDGIPNYDSKIDTADWIFGTVHLILMLISITYMVFSVVRKHRLSRFQWTYLVNLTIVEFLNVIVLY